MPYMRVIAIGAARGHPRIQDYRANMPQGAFLDS